MKQSRYYYVQRRRDKWWLTAVVPGHIEQWSNSNVHRISVSRGFNNSTLYHQQKQVIVPWPRPRFEKIDLANVSNALAAQDEINRFNRVYPLTLEWMRQTIDSAEAKINKSSTPLRQSSDKLASQAEAMHKSGVVSGQPIYSKGKTLDELYHEEDERVFIGMHESVPTEKDSFHFHSPEEQQAYGEGYSAGVDAQLFLQTLQMSKSKYDSG